MSDNTAPKTVGVPFQNGADPRRGHGKKGRSGRKPDWVKRMAERELPATIKFLSQVRDGQVPRKSYDKVTGKLMRFPDGTIIPTPEKVEARDGIRAAELLLKAAGALTTKTELTGKDGGPLEVADATERERATRIAALLSRVGRN